MKFMLKFCCKIRGTVNSWECACPWHWMLLCYWLYSKKGGGLISGISLENRPTHMHMQNVHRELVNHILIVFWWLSLSRKGTAKMCDDCKIAEATCQQFQSPCDVCKGQGEFFSGMRYVQSRNLRNLKTVLRILWIQKLHANLGNA